MTNSYEPLRRILSSSRVNEIQKRLKSKAAENKIIWNEKLTQIKDLEKSNWQPKLLVAIDGDYNVSKIETGFPGSEIGYVTVSTVLILIDKIRELENEDFIDPKEFRKTESPSSIDCVFPGCNSVLNGEPSAKDSMRRILFEEMKSRSIFQGIETLLETFEELLKIKRGRSGNSTKNPKCPHDQCDADLKEGYGEYVCDSCGGVIFSTDALRLHELFNPLGTSGEMYGQIKDVFKKLHLIHLIRSLEKKTSYHIFRDLAFFIEGTLAVFSASSWLAKCIREELSRVNAKIKENCNQDLIILGIEKSGNFVNHFEDIDEYTDDDEKGHYTFGNQTAFLPTNEYIRKNIVLNENPNYIYLEDTSFGRKFFYKTRSGSRVVSTIATYNTYQSNVETAFPAQFPRLADCLALLDDLVSNRYGNTVMPLATAHAEAAIPLNLGKRIFDDLARSIKGQTDVS